MLDSCAGLSVSAIQMGVGQGAMGHLMKVHQSTRTHLRLRSHGDQAAVTISRIELMGAVESFSTAL